MKTKIHGIINDVLWAPLKIRFFIKKCNEKNLIFTLEVPKGTIRILFFEVPLHQVTWLQNFNNNLN
jgi:hypothetical protein